MTKFECAEKIVETLNADQIRKQAKKYAELLKKSLQSRDDSRFDRFVTQSDEMAQYEQRYTVGDKFWDMVEAEIEAATEQ